MADLIRIKCGELRDRKSMPSLSYDSKKGCELGYRLDEKALYIGTDVGMLRLCGVEDYFIMFDEINRIYEQLTDIKNRLDALTTPSE